MAAVLLPGLAYASETNTVTASFSPHDVDGPVGPRTELLDARLVQRLTVGSLTKQDLSCARRPGPS